MTLQGAVGGVGSTGRHRSAAVGRERICVGQLQKISDLSACVAREVGTPFCEISTLEDVDHSASGCRRGADCGTMPSGWREREGGHVIKSYEAEIRTGFIGAAGILAVIAVLGGAGIAQAEESPMLERSEQRLQIVAASAEGEDASPSTEGRALGSAPWVCTPSGFGRTASCHPRSGGEAALR